MTEPTLDEFVHSTLRNAPQNCHPRTGEPIESGGSHLMDEQSVWENMSEPGPSDCVRAVLLPKDMVQLIGYDKRGVPTATLVLPLDSVDGTDEMWVLDLVRRGERAKRHLKLVG